MQSGYRNALAEFIRKEAQPVDKFGHQPRVYALAQLIAEGMSYDDDVLYAAAWLHDLGVFIGHRPEDPAQLAHWDNLAYTLEKAPVILCQLGFPEENIPAVLEAIRLHEASDDPKTPEGIILRDADILEQLGAVGILRTVAKVGRDTRYATFSSVLPVLRRAVTELPDKLKLPRARELARSKQKAMTSFLDAVANEDRGFLY